MRVESSSSRRLVTVWLACSLSNAAFAPWQQTEQTQPVRRSKVNSVGLGVKPHPQQLAWYAFSQTAQVSRSASVAARQQTVQSGSLVFFFLLTGCWLP